MRQRGKPIPEATVRTRRFARLLLTTATLAVGLAFVPVAGAPAASVRPLFEQVGSLDRFAPDARAALGAAFVPEYSSATQGQKTLSGTALVIPELRQMWQFYPMFGVGGRNDTGVVVRDLDSLRIVRTLKFDVMLGRAAAESSGGTWAHAVDTVHGRLFLVDQAEKQAFEVDLRTFRVRARPLWPSANPITASVRSLPIGGLTYDPFEDDLLILYGGLGATSAANVNAVLYRLDTAGPPRATFPPDELAKLYRIRSCTGPVTSTDIGDDTYGWDILVTKEYLYVPCQRAGHTVIMVRMTRPAGNDPDHREDVSAGPVYGEAVLADQDSGRLFVVTYEQEIWAFETGSMSFVGVVATGPARTADPTAYGLDRATGRVFFQSPTFGLGVVEGRFFPIPQARTFPRRAQAQERILSDAATGRVFVLEGWTVLTEKKAQAYRIYHTEPAPVPPSAPDPDRNTADVDEGEAVEARWNATGSGYGSRVILAKGFATVAPAPTVGTISPTAGLIDKGNPQGGTGNTPVNSKCGYTDRDVFAGRVARAEYDTGSTAAQAVAVAVDDATRQDLDQPSRCDLRLFPTPVTAAAIDGQDTGWHYEAAACASSAQDTSAATGSGKGGAVALGPSKVACPVPGGVLSASAESRLTGAVEVARSRTDTVIDRGTHGVRATTTAVARNISITVDGLPAITIGEIRATAVSISNGRPKRKDMSTYELTIASVRVGDTDVCEPVCDPVTLEERLNTVAGSRAVFRTGRGPNSGLDGALVEGSPRGAQTAVQKAAARQASDRALLGDYTVDVPALEMTVFNDTPDWGRARQVYQFAGVATSATYNVVVRPQPVSFDDDPGLSDDPALGGADGALFEGLVERLTEGPEVVSATPAALRRFDDGDGPGGGLAGLVRAVARGLRLLLTSPRTALLLLTAWGLLSSPVVLSRRRRLLTNLPLG